jgi:predicted component of type VI protein secretion system
VLSGVDSDIDIVADSGIFCVGRDAGLNDWVFAKPIVSRSHFSIEYRHGNYVLLDSSNNGTYVTLEGQREMRLKHDELVLQGSGVISLAVAAGVDPELMIRFELQEYDEL